MHIAELRFLAVEDHEFQRGVLLKILAGLGEPLAGRMLLGDLGTMQFKRIALRRRAGCAACGESESSGTTRHGLGSGGGES